VRYWDSSAVVPLVVAEENSTLLLDIWRADSERVVWWGTQTECLSALARRHREGVLDAEELACAERLVYKLLETACEVLPGVEIRAHARRLLMTHPLRAADACQLAGALVIAGVDARHLAFVSLDLNLAACAQKEGFLVEPSRGQVASEMESLG